MKILESVNDFLIKVFRYLKEDGVDVSNFELDHVCYRVKTVEDYEKIKKQLNQEGNLLLENNIGGRLIAKYKLYKPIIFENRKIYIIELPQPKGGEKEGWEHVEFVINTSFEYLMNKYPQLNFKIDGITKKINSDIVLEYNDCVVKFHQQSLEYIIEHFEK
jgi:predicted metalloenzyme YecM